MSGNRGTGGVGTGGDAPSVLILGASARAAAQSALRAGSRPAAIDLFADADLRAIAETRRIEDYPHSFERVFDELPGDCWLYTGGLENYPALVDRLAARRPLLGNRGDVLRWVRDPFWLADCLRAAGFDFPRTEGRLGEAVSKARWLSKPLHGSAGLGIALVSATTHDSRGHYYQELRPGLPASAVFVAAGGRSELLGATRQLIGPPWTNAGPFVYAGNIGPLALPAATNAELRRLGDLLAERAGLTGLLGVDFLLDDDRLCPLEVNPRYPASLEILERATGQPLLAWHFAACLRGELLPPPRLLTDARCHGKAILYARGRTVIGALKAESLLCDALREDPACADIPSAGAAIEPGHPILTLFAEGKTIGEVEAALRQRLQTGMGAA